MDLIEELYTVTIIRKTLEAFQASLLEAIVLFAVVFGLITLLTFVYFFQKRRNYIRKKAFAEERFREALKDKTLSPEEWEVLKLMIEEIPGRELRKHVLVTNDSSFDAAAQKLLKKKTISGRTAASLRIKLGFPQAVENETIYSTAELPQGKKVYCRWQARGNRMETVMGKVKALSPEGLTLELERPPGKRGKVTVLFSQKTGIHRFTTSVIGSEDNTITCEHTDAIQKKQERRFFRKEMKKPVFLETVEGAETKRYRTLLYDLGGGGAKVKNPEKVFSSGDNLNLKLSLDGAELNLKGGVARTSGEDRYLHVEFKDLRDSERDRIMGYLFTK